MIFIRTHHGYPNDESTAYLTWYLRPVNQLLYWDLSSNRHKCMQIGGRDNPKIWVNRYMFGSQAIYLPMVNHETI